MSEIASYIIKKKAASLWKWPNIGKLMLNFFMALFGGLSTGFMAVLLSNYLINIEMLSASQFMFFYTLLLSIPTLLIDIFPSLKPPPIIFQPFYPVSIIDKLKVSIITSFARNYLLFLFLCEALLVLFGEYIVFWDIAVSSSFLLSTYLLNRVFRIILYFTLPRSYALSIVCLSTLFLLVFTYWKLDKFEIILSLYMIFIITNFLLLIYAEDHKKEKLHQPKESYRKGVIFGVIANKNMKTMIWLAFLFKLLLLIFSGVFYLNNGKHFLGFEGFDWLFASPVILFTYFGYNFFGINRNLFLTHSIRVHSIKTLSEVYSKVMLFLVGVDVVVFIIYMLTTNQYSLKFCLFYTTSFILLFLTAFPISLHLPIIKDRYLSFDFTSYGSNTISFRATLTAIGIMLTTLLSTLSEYYWAIFIVLIISTISFAVLYPLNLTGITRNYFEKMRSL